MGVYGLIFMKRSSLLRLVNLEIGGHFLTSNHHHVQISHAYYTHWNPSHPTTSGPDSVICGCGCPKPYSDRPQALCKPLSILPSTLHTPHLPTDPRYSNPDPLQHYSSFQSVSWWAPSHKELCLSSDQVSCWSAAQDQGGENLCLKNPHSHWQS